MTKYIKPATNSIKSVNSSDCAVRALASASGLSYKESLETMTDIGGYRVGGGTPVRGVVRVMQTIGAKLIGAFGTTASAESVAKATGCVRYKGMELEKFISLHKTGSYFVLVRGHATAIVDGELRDNGMLKAGVSVAVVWKF